MKLRTLILAAAFLPGIALANDAKSDQAATRDTSNNTAAQQMNPATATTDQNAAMKGDVKADQKMTDARLMAKLHKVNKMEIDAGKLAEKQGESADVKNYGRKLVADHTAADNKLMAIAKGSDMDSALTKTDKEQMAIDQNKMDEVKKMHGAQFDRAFASVMYNGHKDVIDMLDKSKGDLQSDELKKFVDDTEPVLKKHEDMAGKIMKNEQKYQGRAPQNDKR